MVTKRYNTQADSPFLLICEHASNFIPEEYDNLGLSKEDLQKHIAWDIGAGEVTRYLSDFLKAPAILAEISRLVIDVNRPLDHPTLIVREGEGKTVPGNQNLGKEEINRRIREIYAPFHNEIAEEIDRRLKKRQIPMTIDIHSFTSKFFNIKRPWHIGFLWAQDKRATAHIMSYFKNKGYCVGDNQPYDARQVHGTTVNRHCDTQRLPNVLIEIRHDLIDTKDKAKKWAHMLSEALQELQDYPEVFTRYQGPRIQIDPKKAYRYFDKIIAEAKRTDINTSSA